MATGNHERVGRTLEPLKDGLRPFVERELQARHGDNWRAQAVQTLRQDRERQSANGDVQLDVHALLTLRWFQWNEVFRGTLGNAERSLIGELREVRNRWAHQQPFSSDDAYRALDSMARLLTAISAEVERQKQELLRVRFEEQARRETHKAALVPVEGHPMAGLRPRRVRIGDRSPDARRCARARDPHRLGELPHAIADPLAEQASPDRDRRQPGCPTERAPSRRSRLPP